MAKSVVFRHKIPIGPTFTLPVPIDSMLLHVAVKPGEPRYVSLWTAHAVANQERTENRTFFVVGTGHNFDTDHDVVFIGTAVDYTTGLVWHLFERKV